jgi:glutamate carboxypeptidase
MSLPASIAALPQRTTELVDLLESWANINSGSGHFAGLERMRLRLRDDFARAFPSAQIDEPVLAGTPARAVRIIMRPNAKQRVLLHGHFDTVYEANDAFQTCTRLDANTLRGPGVIDMKGGILVIYAALQAFEATPRASEVGWEVLLTPDEEIGSHGSKPLFRETARQHSFALLYEPARPNGDIVHSRKGTGGFTVTCHGRAAHAAKVPNDGRSAILALAEFLLAAAKIPAELPGVMLNVGNIRGGGPATNVVPDFAESELDVRITRVADRQLLLDRLNTLAAEINARDGLRLELRGGFNRPPKECTAAEEHVFAAWQSAARDVGVKPFTWVHTGGASDGNLFSAEGLPNLDGLGPIGDHLHSNREFITVSSIAPRAQITALFLHRLATGEASLPSRA